MFIQCFVSLPCSSVNVLDRHIHIIRKETTYKTEKKREWGSKRRRRKGEIMGLCVLRVDIPREQVILTLCMHALSSSLSLMASRVRRSKLINHRKSITRRDEGVSFTPERQKRKSLMSYATDTHIYEWSMKSSFLAFFFMCLSTSIRCETVEMVRDEGSSPDHYYPRARAQLIIDLAVVEQKRREKSGNTR